MEAFISVVVLAVAVATAYFGRMVLSAKRSK